MYKKEDHEEEAKHSESSGDSDEDSFELNQPQDNTENFVEDEALVRTEW